MSDRITLSELARRLDVNKGYVHRLKMRGVLIFDRDGLIDEDGARQAIADSNDPAKAYMRGVNDRQRARHRQAPADDDIPPLESEPAPAAANASTTANSSYHRAKATREVLEAKLKGLRLQQELGLVVNAAAVKREQMAIARQVRDGLLNLPSQLAPILAAKNDAREVYEILEKEIRLNLEMMAARLGVPADAMAEGGEQ